MNFDDLISVVSAAEANANYYANKYVSKLTELEKLELENFRQTFYDAKKRILNEGYISFSEEYNSVSKNVIKAFAFLEDIPPNTLIQDEIFRIFEGEELECIFERFLNQWEITREQEKEGLYIHSSSRCWGIPTSFRGLVLGNKDFNISYATPFLTNTTIGTNDKFILIRNWATQRQHNEKSFFTEEEVAFLLRINEEFDVNITSVIPSIRRAYNLYYLPWDWIEAAYLKKGTYLP